MIIAEACRRRHRRIACKWLVERAVAASAAWTCFDNNVGIGSRGSVVDESPEGWRCVTQVNVESMFLVSKYAIPPCSN
jgi:NAD(P)-dependent dehydrogenase (short-subunit alcohol dehydrogenase family)